jgi:FkbM family methyltransferase
MYQAIFNRALEGHGETRRLCRRLRRWILKCVDPVVTWELNGRRLQLRLSHQLPFYRREYPTYSANLERLTDCIRRRESPLIMIDVGANVGDSLALAGIRPDEPCLLIEGNPDYLRLLRANTAELREVVCVEALLSDHAGEGAGQLISADGTGQVIIKGSTGGLSSATNGRIKQEERESGRVHLQTLDRIIEQQPRFRKSHLLKVDVDGYDFRVLRGGADFIGAAQPVLFFEQDPALLVGAGENPDAVWAWLQAAGYADAFVYDNLGFWMGWYKLVDEATLCQLNNYARQRGGFYYDVIAFAPRHSELRDAFVADEKAFYARLL